MILRRIASAFRRQDWVTVFVETMIVVLGVFLGLQVNNWNEARGERIEEKAILLRLVEDYRQLVEGGEEYLTRSARQRRLMTRWIAAAENGELSDLTELRALIVAFYQDEDPARAREMAEGPVSDLFTEPLGGERRPDVSVTFQQLVASGDLKLIRSERVRRALASRAAGREEANRAIGYNHNVEAPALGGAFIQTTFQAMSPNADAILEAALVNPEYTAGLRSFFGLRTFNETWFLRVHNQTQQVLAILEEEAESQ